LTFFSHGVSKDFLEKDFNIFSSGKEHQSDFKYQLKKVYIGEAGTLNFGVSLSGG